MFSLALYVTIAAWVSGVKYIRADAFFFFTATAGTSGGTGLITLAILVALFDLMR